MNPLHKDAIKLRAAGNSYSMISERLGIAKSTLSNWLANIPFTPNQEVITSVGEAKLKSALYKQKLKFDDISKMRRVAAVDVGALSKRDIFMLGIGIYLGEGSKSLEEVKISNSNPAVLKLAIRWLMESTNLDISHFRITLHAYPDNDIANCIKFWSNQTGIPMSQFTKTIIDTRQNKSTLNKKKTPYGTAHLYIRSGGTLFPGVKSLHRKIMGWIEASTGQI